MLRLWQWVGRGFRKVKANEDEGGGATVYLANIPHRMSDCPVYTTAPIPELKMEALPL